MPAGEGVPVPGERGASTLAGRAAPAASRQWIRRLTDDGGFDIVHDVKGPAKDCRLVAAQFRAGRG